MRERRIEMKVVILGTGLVAKFHAAAVGEIPGLEVSAMCARGDDWDAALGEKGVGLCLVANASGAHDRAVEAAARHGVHVLVEKPLGITSARIDAMGAACDAAGVKLGCIFQTRWSEDFRRIKRTVESGELGRITYAAVQVPWWRDDEYYTGSEWHGTREMDGGGALMNQAIHMVDWLTALMPPVAEVKAFAGTLAHPMEAEDTVSAALRFEGGALGHVYATTAARPGRGKRIEINGTGGSVAWEDASHGASSAGAIPHGQHREAIEAFLEWVRGGEEFATRWEEARKPVALIEEIYRAAGIVV